MHMAKSGKKKGAGQYEASTLAAFAIAGIVLITLGVLSLLSVVGGLRGTFFTQVKEVMQGLGGGLCIGISVLLIWGGLLVAFSSGRGMPKRGIFLMTIFYLAVLAVINLVFSKVGQYSLMDYVVAANKEAQPPMVNPDGYWNVICSGYEASRNSGAFGGALGMLLAWPACTFLGTTIGAVVLILICLICVAFFSRLDVMGLFQSMRESVEERRGHRDEERAQREYQQLLEQQRRQQEEDERRLITPAFRRKNKKDMDMPPEAPPMPMQAMYPPFGSMLAQPPLPMQENPYAYADPAAFAQAFAPVQQPEMYDEIIIPQGRQLPWRKGDKKNKKDKNTVQPSDAYQTRMTFTPREVGMADEEELRPDDTLIISGSKKKALERIEEIRRRKADISLDIEGNLQAQAIPSMPAMPQLSAGVHAPVAPPAAVASVVAQPAVVPKPAVSSPAQPVQPMMDRHAAYKRPATEQPSAVPAQDFAPAVRATPSHAAAPVPAEPREKKAYVFPSIDLLNMQQRKAVDTRAQDTENATRLEKTLESFGIPARVQRVTHGPAVTRFELGLVSSGINVKRIMSIADNIALDMAANGGVRIEIPIPGTNLFGIEVPNKEIQSVSLSEVLLSPEMQAEKSPLAVALGRDITGKPIICDLGKMPHLLIAGQTGSGKSVCINAIINSILFRSPPEEVRMIMIDPKVVELQCYNVVPHLLIPVVSDPHKAAGALAWAVAEMLDRYHKIQSKNVRNLAGYNAKLGPGDEKLPRIVIIIDELADLMLACKKEVEESIIRIAQLARAAGIHMVVATQRPTVDVITGLIKANIPSRIAFAVSSSIDSRTILDQNGAEKLLGRGDMFYAPTGASSPVRVQGCFLSDAETERVVGYIGQHSHVDFDPNVIEAMENDEDAISPLDDGGEESGLDDRLAEAIEMVISDGQASISMLQRRMKIGYARAGRLIDDMAARGIVSKSAGSKPREVLMSREEYERMKDTLG